VAVSGLVLDLFSRRVVTCALPNSNDAIMNHGRLTRVSTQLGQPQSGVKSCKKDATLNVVPPRDFRLN
jgi:hypothetical protein